MNVLFIFFTIVVTFCTVLRDALRHVMLRYTPLRRVTLCYAALRRVTHPFPSDLLSDFAVARHDASPEASATEGTLSVCAPVVQWRGHARLGQQRRERQLLGRPTAAGDKRRCQRQETRDETVGTCRD